MRERRVESPGSMDGIVCVSGGGGCCAAGKEQKIKMAGSPRRPGAQGLGARTGLPGRWKGSVREGLGPESTK